MIELIASFIALIPFAVLTYQDWKRTAVKNGLALLFAILSFVQAVIRYDFPTATVIFALAITLAVLMQKFKVIRPIDVPIFIGYSLLVMNFIWMLLGLAVISAFAYMNIKKEVLSPMTPALFSLFIIYCIGYLGVALYGI